MQRVIGFGASMALLAVASLMMIPAMVRASGAVAWGAMALGQAVGSIGAVLVGYGWNMSGPAQLAGADPSQARAQFLESVLARLALMIPVSAGVILFTWFSAPPGFRLLAIVGGLSATTIGLSANWYFVGMVQPWALLTTETLPRVGGTFAGTVAMWMGGNAMDGAVGQLLGMVTAVALSAIWVVSSAARRGAEKRQLKSVPRVLAEQKDGVVASVSSTAMGALPVLLVAHSKPAAQPLYAFVDKLQRQIAVALVPFVTVLQGWVPRGDRLARARRTIQFGALLGLFLSGFTFLAAPLLTKILGAGELHTTWQLNLCMGIFVGMGLYELMLSHAVLSTFNRLQFVAATTIVTGLISLALIVPGVQRFDALGAVVAVLSGLFLRVLSEAWQGLVTVKALASSLEENSSLAASAQVPHKSGALDRTGPLAAPRQPITTITDQNEPTGPLGSETD
ncbi:hypothetical protein [Luteococcus sanguinis]|uniref:Lipopolysaccharide biosynthesis protein n=1 Tax=Luteococcus sanguinis TaxID=174038 RepID=A0ABW1X5F5_9ACTN